MHNQQDSVRTLSAGHAYRGRTFSWSRSVKLIPPFDPALRVRLGRPGADTSAASPHRSGPFRASGVSNTSPSSSSTSSASPKRLDMGVASSARRLEKDPFGETAVVPVEVEGMRSFRAGVENVEANEPRETSGIVPEDCADVSAWAFSAADMVAMSSETTRTMMSSSPTTVANAPKLCRGASEPRPKVNLLMLKPRLFIA